MDNKTLILNEFETLKGQFIINGIHQIERLVAIGEDQHDYYYVTYNGRELRWSSCVGHIMPLKGHLREDDYAELVRSAMLNHYDQLTAFKNHSESYFICSTHKETLITSATNNGDKFLTEVCWDLN
jgi:hypothetical protein